MKHAILWAPIAACALTIGCKDKVEPKPATTSSAVAVNSAEKSAKSVTAKPKKSVFPPQARRNSAPKGLTESALAVGKEAPKLEAVPATTGKWTRGEKTTVLVFYRGHW